MKRHIILFAIFITAIFYYPVFAYADRIGLFVVENSVSEPTIFFLIGSGLLAMGGLTRRFIQTR